MQDIVLIIHNVRSTLNVGAMLRTAEGLGVKKVYLSGYTPYPIKNIDSRLPHLAIKTSNRIEKTALGATATVKWQQRDNVLEIIEKLRTKGYQIVALEQTNDAIALPDYKPKKKVAIIVGNEVNGIDEKTLAKTDQRILIPMLGKKESFNVSAASAMMLYHIRFGL